MQFRPRDRYPPGKFSFDVRGTLGALMVVLPSLLAANLSFAQISTPSLANEHSEPEWTIPLRSREPIESESAVPYWLTLSTIWAIFGFAVVNTWLSASEEGAIAILRRGWRGPHLDQLYLPLLCREQGGLAAGHWERLRRIDSRWAVLFSSQAMARGTQLRMEISPATALHTHDDHHLAASFRGKVTQCCPVRHDPEWFQVKVRIDSSSTHDSSFSLHQLLTSLAPTPLSYQSDLS